MGLTVIAPTAIELGYVEKVDADFTTASTTPVDVTGLTLPKTFSVARTVEIRAGGSMMKCNNAGGIPQVLVMQGATRIRSTQGFAANASQQFPFGNISRRLVLAAGTYTFKIQFQTIGTGTSTLVCNATDGPVWLQIMGIA